MLLYYRPFITFKQTSELMQYIFIYASNAKQMLEREFKTSYMLHVVFTCATDPELNIQRI